MLPSDPAIPARAAAHERGVESVQAEYGLGEASETFACSVAIPQATSRSKFGPVGGGSLSRPSSAGNHTR